MARILAILLCLGLAISLASLLGGCPNLPLTGDDTTQGDNTNGTLDDDDDATNDTDDEGDDEEDDEGDDESGDEGDDEGDDQDLFPECGDRTITALPPAGYVQTTVEVELDADPSDSGLAKVMFGAALCPEEQNTEMPVTLYQIDASGNITATYWLTETAGQKIAYGADVTNQQLVVEDGCLVQEGETTEDDEDEPDDPTEPEENPCGDMAVAVSREGIDSEPSDPYICVEVRAVSACQNCWYDGTAWHTEFVATGYYIAAGTLDGISVYEWAAVCDPENEDATVTITQGDRVDFTWTYRLTYETSQSPADLGYAEVGTTP